MEKMVFSAYINIVSKEVTNYFDEREGLDEPETKWINDEIQTEDYYKHVTMKGKLEALGLIEEILHDSKKFSIKKAVSILKDRLEDIDTIMSVFEDKDINLSPATQRHFEARLVFGCKDIFDKVIEKFD